MYIPALAGWLGLGEWSLAEWQSRSGRRRAV